MIEISKESLAPRRFERRIREHREVAATNVVEIAYCLFLCGGARNNIHLEKIAGQALITYPQLWVTWINGELFPDLASILLTLTAACSKDWDYMVGDWSSGWHLTKRGREIAQDVERRRIHRIRDICK